MRRTFSLAVMLSLVALSAAAAAQEQNAAAPQMEASADAPALADAAQVSASGIVYTDECPAIEEVLPPVDRQTEFARKYRLVGTASYYSTFFEGRRTASGEIYRNRGYTAAHRTLPFGTLVEVTSRATGKKVRVRVNDRGPFSGGFILDLTPAAARKIGVDRTEDRTVDIRIIALPGEDVPPEHEDAPATVVAATGN